MATGDGTGGTAPGWLARLLGHCWRHRRSVVLALAGAVTGMAALAAVPLLQRAIVDDVILGTGGDAAVLAGALLVTAAVGYAATFLRRYFAGRLSLDVQYDLRTALFAALSRLDGAQQDQLHTGQIVGRAISDITMVQRLLALGPILIGNLLLFVMSLLVMAWLSPLLTVVALAVGPALYAIAGRSRRRLFPASWDAQQQTGTLAGVVDDAVAGVRVVKGFGQEEQELSKLESAARRLFASRMRVIRLTARYDPALQSVPALGQIGVLALGGWLALRGGLSLGTFLAFSAYLTQLVGPVRMLANLLTVGQQAKASVIRVLEVIDSRPRVAEAPAAVECAGGPAAVELRDVTFGYPGGAPVLRGLSLRVEPGETVALVGPSGSGKSTVSMLVPRFYDVTSGQVLVAGHDVRDVTLASLRRRIGLVMADSFLFSDTIHHNIAYGRPEADREEVVAAAKAAEADEFIRDLPDGYDTVVGEQGLTLSGGQRQRVCLARALLTDPDILILDDATSAVDAQVEAEIHATLRKVMAGRTTLLVAHRRSTLALADRIVVLDAGRVVDSGTHEELQERCPLYRRLLSGDPADPVAAPVAPPGPARQPAPAAVPAGPYHRVGAVAVPGRIGGRGGGALTSQLAALPATPELLAQVRALPPARDTPGVDAVRVREPEPRFTLRRLLRPLAAPLLASLGLVAVTAAAGLALPWLVRYGIDHGVAPGAPGVLVAACLVGLAVVGVNWAVSAGQILVAGRTGERLLYLLRVKAFAHLQRLGLDFYERELSGRIMTRMTTDIDALATFLQTGLATAVVSLLSLVGVAGVMVALNAELALVVLSVMPVLVVATLVFRARSAVAYDEAREKVGIVNADLQENIAGLRVTQAYLREGHNRRRFARRSHAYRTARLRGQRYIATYFPFVQFLAHVAALLTLLYGARLIERGALTAGALIAYLLYLELLFSPVQQLSHVFDSYQQAAVGLRRLRGLLRTPPGTPAPAVPRSVPRRLAGEVTFHGVRFRYPGQSDDALAGIDLVVAPGETVAVVGRTGAGKSTLVKLVARFYDPTGGSVRVDGVDVRAYDLAGYRHRLGVVPQEAYLFPGTVRDAIAYGRPDATDTEVEAAARAVGAHDMITALPGGYRHPVHERGRNLSSGQRQLLALARAQLVDPDILLLDEATAALDLATEAQVTRATERLTGRRTTLVVAHRLGTAARADRVVVLDHGRIVESGSHADLLAAGGVYAAMWEAFEGAGTRA
ncbi:MAG TPA: ABC transporter ATP-binding protein [Natronosporangium sp.]|nr:ABC transporter ATP-binding protein [Natronosporangium sp.]